MPAKPPALINSSRTCLSEPAYIREGRKAKQGTTKQCRDMKAGKVYIHSNKSTITDVREVRQ